jgi:hypothetical protein
LIGVAFDFFIDYFYVFKYKFTLVLLGYFHHHGMVRLGALLHRILFLKSVFSKESCQRIGLDESCDLHASLSLLKGAAFFIFTLSLQQHFSLNDFIAYDIFTIFYLTFTPVAE